MSERPPVDLSAISEKRKRRRLFARLALAAAALFFWPAILQIEKLAARVESLKVLDQVAAAAGPGARHGIGQRLHAGHRRGGPAAAPLGDVAPLEGLPGAPQAQLPAIVTLADARVSDFIPPLGFGLTAPSQGGPNFPLPPPLPGAPDPGVIVGPSGPGGGPGGGPPVTHPPVVDPGGPNPPVKPPVVDPGPPQPPVVTPPSNPPVVQPPPVTNPPVEGPDGGTFTPPGGDSGGGPGGGNPTIPPAPEPAVWMQLVLGASLAGAALRRARARWGQAKIA